MNADGMVRRRRRLQPQSGASLRRKVLPPLKWLVESHVPEGLTLLVGPPKVGKSRAALDIALSVAAGRPVLGEKTARVATLYCALEDSERRLQDRMNKLLGDDDCPDGFFYLMELPDLDHDLAAQLDDYLEEHRDIGLVIIDVLAKVRGARQRNEDAYAHDARTLHDLHRIALDRRVSLIIVHHTRKAAGSYSLEEVSGTYGLTGVADTVLLLTPTADKDEKRLRSIGRDLPEQHDLLLAVEDDRFRVVGPYDEYSDDKRASTLPAILKVLRDEGGPARAAHLAHRIGKSENAVWSCLSRESKKPGAKVVHDERGYWDLAEGAGG